MLKKFLQFLLLLCLLGVAGIAYTYSSARSEALARLKQNALNIETSMGSVEYRIIGDRGPYMLYIPPAAYDSKPLISENYRVIVPSRPGYAGTELSLAATPQAQAMLYNALLDALDIDSVIVQTVSAGGPSALYFSAMYPQRTSALIAMSPLSDSLVATSLPPFLATDFRFWLLINSISLAGDEVLANAFLNDHEQVASLLNQPERLAALHNVVWSLWPLSVRQRGSDNDAVQFRELNIPFADISAPTLIVHGSADTNVPLQQSQKLVEALPHGSLQVIEGGEHMMFLTHGELIQLAFNQFLDALPR